MKTNRCERNLRLALMTACVVLMTMSARAQTPASASAPVKTAAPSATPPPPAATVARPQGLHGSPVTVNAPAQAPAKKPGQEGVAMHGHWIIDLRNADGTIAEHREFENGLLSPTFLFYVVTGQFTSADLGITIGSTGSAVCANVPGTTNLGSCLVAASATAGLGITCAGTATGYCNYTLKEVTSGGYSGTGAITLTGTMPVLASGTVTQVGTQFFGCNNNGGVGTYSPVDTVGCYNQTETNHYLYGNLTGTSIPALNVVSGQTLLFTVVLTFS